MRKGSEAIPVDMRFWSKVAILGEDDCWEWLGGRNTAGYGKFFAIIDGRCKSQRGELNHMAKLTNSDVIEIRRLAKEGFSSAQLAERYHLSRSALVAVKSRRSWNHL